MNFVTAVLCDHLVSRLFISLTGRNTLPVPCKSLYYFPFALCSHLEPFHSKYIFFFTRIHHLLILPTLPRHALPYLLPPLLSSMSLSHTSGFVLLQSFLCLQFNCTSSFLISISCFSFSAFPSFQGCTDSASTSKLTFFPGLSRSVLLFSWWVGHLKINPSLQEKTMHA